MATSIVSIALALAVGSTGGLFNHRGGGRVMPPGPGYGWGFPNGNPDGYGWVDYGDYLPLGPDRTPEYYFPRYHAMPAEQMFFPTYSNPYAMRGQRYLPYTGGGGEHPMGGPPTGTAETPMHPYNNTIGSASPASPLPSFSGRVEAPPVNSGNTGLTP